MPDLPTETEYLINSGALTLNLAPEFTQYPPCDYVLDMVPVWTFDPSPAPYAPNPADEYEFSIDTDNLAWARF